MSCSRDDRNDGAGQEIGEELDPTQPVNTKRRRCVYDIGQLPIDYLTAKIQIQEASEHQRSERPREQCIKVQ